MSFQNIRRYSSSEAVQLLEERTLFSGYALSVVAPIPAVSSMAFVNTQVTPLVRDSAGNLYGFDPQGGATSAGTLFEVTPSTKTLNVLYTFNGTGAEYPNFLAIDSAGNLFGLSETSAGGAGHTLLFEFPAANRTTPTTLYTFNDTAIGFPSNLMVDLAGNVDVVTTVGNSSGGGSIIQFAASGGYTTPTTLATLPAGTGVYPSEIAQAPDGSIYGLSAGGGDATQGTSGDGFLFRLPAGSSTITTLATFDSATTGSAPVGLYMDASGNVFGTSQTGRGDGNFYGDVWEYSPASNTLSTVAGFNDTTDPNGIQPLGGVVGDGNGNLIGTTTQGSAGGTAFSVNPSTHAITTLAAFSSSTTGITPEVGLTPDGSGNFFGVTTSGSTNNRGAVFELSPSTSSGGGGTAGGSGGGTTTGTGSVAPTIAKSTLPATIIASAKAKTANVTVSITNTGTTTDASTTQLYASTDGSVDSSSVLVGKPTKKLTLKAGKTGKATIALPKLSLTAGSYTIFAKTTDTAGAISVATGPSLQVSAPVISLSASVGAVSPTTVVAGKTIGFMLTLTNAGNVDSIGPATIAIGLSVDGTTAAVVLKPQKKSLKVKAGGLAIALKLHIAIPKSQAAGTYFPVVTFTQGTSTFTAVGTTSFAVA